MDLRVSRRTKAPVFESPRGVRFKCDGCALCCGDTATKARRILMLEAEAARISEETSRNIDEFAERVEGPEPFAFVMRKEGGRCLHLRGSLCSIYDARPLICRFYPFELRSPDGETYIFSPTDECPGVGSGPPLGRAYFEELFEELQRRTEVASPWRRARRLRAAAPGFSGRSARRRGISRPSPLR